VAWNEKMEMFLVYFFFGVIQKKSGICFPMKIQSRKETRESRLVYRFPLLIPVHVSSKVEECFDK